MATKRVGKKLTIDLLERWKTLPDNACVSNKELREILGVKNLSSYLQYNLLPAPNKIATQFLKTDKLQWRLGDLRKFVTRKTENTV